MDLSPTDTHMVIKYFSLFALILSFEALGASNENTWLHFQSLGEEILKSEEVNQSLKEKHEEFTSERKKLETMAFKEDEADRLDTKVDEHLKTLSEKKYLKGYEVAVSYFSFQLLTDFKNAGGASKIIVTNNVFCIGGAYGTSNKNFHYWVDGCAFYGKGNAGSVENKITFEQDNLDTYGTRISPAVGFFVSSLRSELGFKLPLLYTHQKITEPANASLKASSSVQALASFYYRFPVNQWFFQMEFGKFLSQDTTLWGFGGGLSF